MTLASTDGGGDSAADPTSYIQVERPSYVVRAWAWILCPPGSDMGPSDWPQVLSEETRLTLRFEERKDHQGEPRTTIRLQHDRLPVEWIEDMTDWWEFQLAIADHRGFGTK